MNIFKSLANSQGFYCRVLQDLEDMSEEMRDRVLRVLEAQNFKDVVDLVMYMES